MRSAPLLTVVAVLASGSLGCSSDTTSTDAKTAGSTPTPTPEQRPKAPDTGPADPSTGSGSVTTACTGEPGTIYAFALKPLAVTDDVQMCAFKGKVLLIVNGASGCGYTPQYGPLQKLYEKHQAAGFTALGFPSNSFNQEAGGAVTTECADKYGIRFPLLAINPVIDDTTNNVTAQPLYKWLYAQPGMAKPVAWNFEKFLISKDGKVVKRWLSAVQPEIGSEIDLAIEAELAKP